MMMTNRNKRKQNVDKTTLAMIKYYSNKISYSLSLYKMLVV
jgi:hypothetical protein